MGDMPCLEQDRRVGRRQVQRLADRSLCSGQVVFADRERGGEIPVEWIVRDRLCGLADFGARRSSRSALRRLEHGRGVPPRAALLEARQSQRLVEIERCLCPAGRPLSTNCRRRPIFAQSAGSCPAMPWPPPRILGGLVGLPPSALPVLGKRARRRLRLPGTRVAGAWRGAATAAAMAKIMGQTPTDRRRFAGSRRFLGVPTAGAAALDHVSWTSAERRRAWPETRFRPARLVLSPWIRRTGQSTSISFSSSSNRWADSKIQN